MIERIKFHGMPDDPASMNRKLVFEIDDLDRLTVSIYDENQSYKTVKIESAFDVFEELRQMVGEV